MFKNLQTCEISGCGSVVIFLLTEMTEGRPRHCGGGKTLPEISYVLSRCGLTNDIYLLRGGAVLKLSGDELVLLAE